MVEQTNNDNPESTNGEKEFWEKVKYLLNHKEISALLNYFDIKLNGCI